MQLQINKNLMGKEARQELGNYKGFFFFLDKSFDVLRLWDNRAAADSYVSFVKEVTYEQCVTGHWYMALVT